MDLKKRIKELEQQLEEAKQNTYIHDTNHLQCSDGELHIGFGDIGENERWLVWNTDSLFKDLPFIINQVVKENNKMQNMYLDRIKEELICLELSEDIEYDEQLKNDPNEI